MSKEKLIKMQLLVRTGLDVRLSNDVQLERTTRLHQYTAVTEQGRIFVVLGNHRTKEKLIKAQIDVIAQLNQIMNNTSIKRA